MFKFFKSKIKKISTSLGLFTFAIGSKIKNIFSREIDESTYEELEQLFYESDLGVTTSCELVDTVKDLIKKDANIDIKAILQVIKEKLLLILQQDETTLPLPITSPHVIVVVGVNGSGKTTSVAKLANHYKNQGKKVLIAAADTFRAAAVEQLTTWANKTGVDIIKSQPKSDPASVTFDALTAAKARNIDIVIVDTAGRLHTKTELMEELRKIRRVCTKVVEEAPHETLLVLDATTGQNALDQAEIFHEFTPISGIILTKLDGSAKGGIVIAIKKQLSIPVKWIGLGEAETDIMPFDATTFIDEMLAIEE